VIGVESLDKVDVSKLYEVLEPVALLERFAAKKASRVGRNNEFLALRG